MFIQQEPCGDTSRCVYLTHVTLLFGINLNIADSNRSLTGILAGSITGAAVLILAIVGFIYWHIYRKQRQNVQALLLVCQFTTQIISSSFLLYFCRLKRESVGHTKSTTPSSLLGHLLALDHLVKCIMESSRQLTWLLRNLRTNNWTKTNSTSLPRKLK